MRQKTPLLIDRDIKEDKTLATRVRSLVAVFVFIYILTYMTKSVSFGELIKMETNMLSEQLVVELKSKTKLVDDQIASITESEGWEIIQDNELLHRENRDG